MLTRFGITVPVLAAPMAGGPTTPAMAIAASRAGSLGMLAAGYKTTAAVEEQIKEVRAESVPFGVNLFAPNPLPVDPAHYRRYAAQIRPAAKEFGLNLPSEPVEDDDAFDEKVELLLDDPVPLVGFTFGIPPTKLIGALKSAGSALVQTVTTLAEAVTARDAGVDMLAVQAYTAGGHSGTLTPATPLTPTPITDLVAQITAAIDLPVLAAGGLATPQAVAAVIRAGAAAALIGTALLRATESGASNTHRAALVDPNMTETVMTRAFTGRPARGLRNAFVDAHEADAPLGYPAIHHLTSPLRKAAAAAGRPEYVHLWAGTGYRHAADEPTADILHRLAADLA